MVRCSEQDAHKGRPYYGRIFECIHDFRIKTGACLVWIS